MRLWQGTYLRVGVLALVLALALPGVALGAEPVFEKYKVPTVGGAEINVEVMRPADNPDAPVILTYSPYNTLSETTTPEPGERRPRPALPGEGLRPRGRRRARHAQLVRLLGLRRRRRAAVRRRPRELPGRAAVDERQGRDDRRLLRRHHRHDGRRPRRRRAGPRGDRPDRRHQPLVRLRLRRRRALLPELGAPDRRGHRHAAGVRLRPRAHSADRPQRPALRREAGEPGEPVRVRRPHGEGLRPHARLRRLLARARLPQGRREHHAPPRSWRTAGRTTT